MDVRVAVFIFGAILALIALLGGGFRIFGAEIPGPVGKYGRGIAGLGGATLIVVSLLNLLPSTVSSGSTPTSTTQPSLLAVAPTQAFTTPTTNLTSLPTTVQVSATTEPTAAPTREPTTAPTREPTATPAQEPTAAPTPVLPSPTPNSGLIPFAAPDKPDTLNPLLGWQPGSSAANSYDLTLNPATLTLIAGANTDQWEGDNTAPLVTYPFHGNFEAEVKVVFSPTRDYQKAGLGIRSAEDANTWLSISRNYHSGVGGQANWVVANRQGSGIAGNSIPYSGETVYFKIARRGAIFNLSYSQNGSNWVTLQKDYVFELPDAIEIYLVTCSSHNDEGITAQFSDFTVLSR